MIALIKLIIDITVAIMLMIALLVGIPLFVGFVIDIKQNYKANIKDWKTLPNEYKQILVTFDTFHKYYIINPNGYKLKTDFGSHPVRGNFIFQFSSYREWRKYQKWLNDGVLLEKNHNNEEAFADILQADLDAMQEKHIQWLEVRKREFEEQRNKYLKG